MFFFYVFEVRAYFLILFPKLFGTTNVSLHHRVPERFTRCFVSQLENKRLSDRIVDLEKRSASLDLELKAMTSKWQQEVSFFVVTALLLLQIRIRFLLESTCH